MLAVTRASARGVDRRHAAAVGAVCRKPWCYGEHVLAAHARQLRRALRALDRAPHCPSFIAIPLVLLEVVIA